MDTRKQRVQFDFTPDDLELLDSLKERTSSPTRADAVRNAIRFHYDHLPQGPRKLVLNTVQEVPDEIQRVLASRLEDSARVIARVYDSSRDQMFRFCLSMGKDILYELCHTYDPPINPMSTEMVIAKAMIPAMETFMQVKNNPSMKV